ncbi:MAG: ribosomal-protein-alanine N-acetyltransferase [Patiriisocius sp.]|jgi:ribosomal-protein-alanine N-acetyltransferase
MKTSTLQAIRTQLRSIRQSDLQHIHDLHSLPEVDQFNTLGIPVSIEDTNRVITLWLRDLKMPVIKNYTFSINSLETKNFIGLFGLKLGTPKYKRGEIWCKIHPDYWNQGYATETVKQVLAFGFSKLALHRIEAGCAVDNIGSFKVLEKAGFVREGRCRQTLPLVSGWSDNYEYAILENDSRDLYL